MSVDAVGLIVASHEGPRWNMEVGRPAVFKLLSEQTSGRIAVLEEIVPPGMGTPLHLHRTSDEVIYVLSGQFSVRLGEKTQTVSADSWIFIRSDSRMDGEIAARRTAACSTSLHLLRGPNLSRSCDTKAFRYPISVRRFATPSWRVTDMSWSVLSGTDARAKQTRAVLRGRVAPWTAFCDDD